MALNCKVLPGCSMLHYIMLHILASTSLLLNTVFGYQSLFFIIFQTLSMEFISGQFLGNCRMSISLHSRDFLVLLELWHITSWCLKINTSVGSQHIHMNLYFIVIIINAIVVFDANRQRNIMLSVFRLL